MEKVPNIPSLQRVSSSRTQVPTLELSEAERRVLKAALSWFRHALREDSLKPYEVALFEAVADLRLEAKPSSIRRIGEPVSKIPDTHPDYQPIPSTLQGLGHRPLPEIVLPDHEDDRRTQPIPDDLLDDLLVLCDKSTLPPK